MSQNNFAKRFLNLLLFSILAIGLNAQYSYNIIGNSCVVPGFSNYGYNLTGGPSGYNDKWCITGGVISGTSNSCMVNSGYGNTGIYVTWNSGITSGSVSYYAHNTDPSPSVTLNVTIVNNTISTEVGPYLYVSLNKPAMIKLTGSDASTPCATTYLYYWQKSSDNVNFTSIDAANDKDFVDNESLSQTVYFRRMLVLDNVPSYSTSVPIIPVTPLNAGTVSPALATVKSGTSAVSFSSSAASGGSMCGPNSYSYYWETSTDNVNWTVQGTNATSFSTGAIYQKTYVRQRITCGPLNDVSNVAVINLFNLLDPGMILPDNKVVAVNVDPGILLGNPARYGSASTYTYQWQQCSSPDFSSNVTSISGATSLNYHPPAFISNGITYFRRAVTCDGVTAYSNVISIVTGTPTTNQNYIKSRDIAKPAITTKQAADALSSTQDVLESTQYVDPLGRPSQNVIKQGSLNTAAGNSIAYDLISLTGYNNRDQEAAKYLPYASSSATDGLFKTSGLDEQYAFNSNLFANENYYYSLTNFEKIPDPRVRNVMPQGQNWIGSNIGIENKYTANVLADNVRVWSVTENGAGQFATYTSSLIYAAGQLLKSIVIDENGKQIIEFKNKDGLTVMKKVQLAGIADNGAGSGYIGWLCTYYIYDVYNNLRAVIQPAGVDYLYQNSWSLAGTSGATVLDEQFFRYEYDSRNRMTMKKIPGAAAVYMIYDTRDRVVLTQDGNLRQQNKWLFTKYDEINRPIISGFYTNTTNIGQSSMQSLMDGQSIAFESYTGAYPIGYTNTSTFPSSSTSVNTCTFYDNYSFTSLYGSSYGTFDNSFNSSFTFSTTAFPYAQPLSQSTAVKGLVTGTYDNAVGPWLITSYMYDSYGRAIQTRSFNTTQTIDITTMQYAFSGKVLETVLNHIKGHGNQQNHTLIIKTNYDNLWRIATITKQLTSIFGSGTTYTVSKPEQVIVQNTYDALGQLKNKKLGINPQNTLLPLETVDYDYNIRGWLLGANKNYLKDKATSGYVDRFFGYELAYDRGLVTPNADGYGVQYQLNGNISATVWKSAGDEVRRKYNYFYDEVNRLTQAQYFQSSSPYSGNYSASEMDYTVMGPDASNNYKIKYDLNGNILAMAQRGWKPGSPTGQVDGLRYTYYDYTNKLKQVTDDNNDYNSKLGDFKYDPSSKSSTADYGYDVNGNLVTDQNKKIGTSTGVNLTSGGGITYNYFNLPVTVSLSGGRTVSYTYDNSGNKLQKTTYEPSGTVILNGTPTSTSITTTTMYMGPFVYESKSYGNSTVNASMSYSELLQFISTEEGRIRPIYNATNTITAFAYDHFLKDHLGNVRMVLTEEQRPPDVYPAATLEGSTSNPSDAVYVEKDYYSINPSNIAYIQGSYYNNNGTPPGNPNPNSNQSVTSNNVYQLTASSGGGVTGLGITLKVMSGDRIDIWGRSFYSSSNSSQVNYPIQPIDILNGLFSAPKSTANAKGGSASDINGIPSINTAINSFLTDPTRGGGTVPKAYVNYILFDEQFNKVGGGFLRVDNANPAFNLPNIPVSKNGYVYVYVSNESPVPVYFDNLQVSHIRGPILEETHYYPFGLAMAGISSQALGFGQPQNKKKFNAGSELQNKEFSDGSGLEMYDTKYRGLDPQIGRWWQLDPKPNYDFSLYSAFDNNPVRFNDPLGDTLPPPPKNAFNPFPDKKINPWHQSSNNWGPPGSNKGTPNNSTTNTSNKPSGSKGNNSGSSEQPTTGTTVTIKVGKDGNTYIDGTGGKTETAAASGQQYGKVGVINQDVAVTHNQDGTVDIQHTYSIGPLSVSTDYMGSFSIGYEIQPGIQLSIGQTGSHKLTGGISATSSTGHVDEANLKYTPSNKLVNFLVGAIATGVFGPAGAVGYGKLVTQ